MAIGCDQISAHAKRFLSLFQFACTEGIVLVRVESWNHY